MSWLSDCRSRAGPVRCWDRTPNLDGNRRWGGDPLEHLLSVFTAGSILTCTYLLCDYGCKFLLVHMDCLCAALICAINAAFMARTVLGSRSF